MRTAFTTILLIWLATPLTAQEQSLTELEPVLPITPTAPQRDLRGDAEDQQFDTAPREPVAGFVDSLTDSDAIVEVVLGRARVLTLKEPLAQDAGVPLVAVGDPSVVEFDVAGPRLIRLVSKRVGVSDFAVTTDSGETYSFDVHVVYDVPLLQAYMQQLFPEAEIRIRQLREHLVLEGQARSTDQLVRIEQTLQTYMRSLQPNVQVSPGETREVLPPGEAPPEELPPDEEAPPAGPSPLGVPDVKPETEAEYPAGQIINLMTVPGAQQVMLKVQVAELNRTSLRRIGADISVRDGGRTVVDTFLGNFVDSTVDIFPSSDVDLFINALRSNSVLNVLAEPTLVAMHGQDASFLAGGEFPFPVPQASGGVGATVITIQFKPFGVQLNFVPYILDDDTIRLRVAPEVSSLNFNTPIAIQGITVPAIDSRAVNTTVELSQGETLAIGGLLQVTLDANTQRIPGIGDVPYIGPLFSNTSHQRVEKELLVLVTPYLVSPMGPEGQVCLPGEEILDPNDCEFYFLNRIEGRTGTAFRSTTAWDNPCGLVEKLNLERRTVCGPVGYSD